ncbi:AAA family ATPase [Evansella tamaricis]|uniref:SMC family ATPase n=1 Tax=Evansella tamaricis TaxID=2069301 RepID=A0ABS6JCF7_9BACI|nr:SMC family ATPase [Evansella tamaricis]MBU9710527.1 SMC family ATPase [Evansella tamaricis]
MKPIKITMTAFGPYKDKEVIEFKDLKENKIFVVSGNTGAGKTTIFDGICFALYGSASGEDRSDAKLLRSHFANDDDYTSVELEFELHGRHYRILRQLPHQKKGNKSATGERYEFFEKINDEEIPCVDRQIVSEINKKVEAIMGLSKDQFSQIVMLPQGEFRKLLTSQTDNKEAILRKIFRTEPYKWFSERLKDKKTEKDDKYKREVHTRDRYISDIAATIPERDGSTLFEALSQETFNTNQVIAGLEEETSFYNHEIDKNNKRAEDANAAYDKKLEVYHKAESVNGEFRNLEKKEEHLLSLEKQEPVVYEKQIQLEQAEKAIKIEPFEQHLKQWRQDETSKVQALKFAEQKEKNALKDLEKAQLVYDTEEKKKTEREEVSRELDRYNDYLPKVKEIDNDKEELRSINKTVWDLEGKRKKILENMTDVKNSQEKLRSNVEGSEQAADQFNEKNQQLLEMRDHAKTLKGYLDVAKNQEDLEKKRSKKQEAYQVEKDKFDALEEAWLKGQAIILAEHLHDGETCPVCGSKEHPNKATNQQGTVPTKEEYEEAKKQRDKFHRAYLDVEARLKSIKEQLDDKRLEIAEIGIQPDQAHQAYSDMVEEGTKLKAEVDKLEKRKEKLPQLRMEAKDLEAKLKKLDIQKDDTEKLYQEAKTSYTTKKAVYEEQLKPIPEEIRELTTLNEKINEAQERKRKLEKAWEDAQEQLTVTKEEATKKTADVVNAKSRLAECIDKRKQAERHFNEALQDASFPSKEAYEQAKMPKADREQLKVEIEKFRSDLLTLKQQVAELKASLKDKTKVDLEALQSEVEELKNANETAGEQLRQSKQYHQQTNDLKTKITEAEESVKEVERELQIIANLYDVVRGQNSSKISFERYLQIEFLEQIIVAANERLRRISNGQFHLIRSERQESHGRQSGLGLDVFDAYTGQTRDVKTLSGGEKFNASLCLALGMADVIQSYQGSVSIDTMFIDEGFGSLDEESLNKAIDTLIDLQKSGRMIGVISHVQELKNTIPAILEVKKTKEGFSKTEFVIK